MWHQFVSFVYLCIIWRFEGLSLLFLANRWPNYCAIASIGSKYALQLSIHCWIEFRVESKESHLQSNHESDENWIAFQLNFLIWILADMAKGISPFQKTPVVENFGKLSVSGTESTRLTVLGFFGHSRY